MRAYINPNRTHDKSDFLSPRSSTATTATIGTVWVSTTTTISAAVGTCTCPTDTNTCWTNDSTGTHGCNLWELVEVYILSIDFSNGVVRIRSMFEINKSKARRICCYPYLWKHHVHASYNLKFELTSLTVPNLLKTFSISFREIPAAKSETWTR